MDCYERIEIRIRLRPAANLATQFKDNFGTFKKRALVFEHRLHDLHKLIACRYFVRVHGHPLAHGLAPGNVTG